MLFKKIKKHDKKDGIKKPKYYIPYNTTNLNRLYEVTVEEEQFFDILIEKSSHLKGEYQLSRLSDGTVNLSYNGYPIGKIKLQGRKKRMQVLTSINDNEVIEGTFENFVQAIDIWLQYITMVLKEK